MNLVLLEHLQLCSYLCNENMYLLYCPVKDTSKRPHTYCLKAFFYNKIFPSPYFFLLQKLVVVLNLKRSPKGTIPVAYPLATSQELKVSPSLLHWYNLPPWPNLLVLGLEHKILWLYQVLQKPAGGIDWYSYPVEWNYRMKQDANHSLWIQPSHLVWYVYFKRQSV